MAEQEKKAFWQGFKHRAKGDLIPGGFADYKKTKDFVASKLRQGTKVEMEHTNLKAIAEEIAKDHLTEDENYYNKLKKMERKK